MTGDRRDQALERVASIIADMTGIEASQITPDKELRALGIDSLDGLEILGEIEDVFHISVTNKDARALVTVNDMVDGIIRLQDEAAAKSEPEVVVEPYKAEAMAPASAASAEEPRPHAPASSS